MGMIPWGAIISLAGQAASGIMSAVNNKKMKQNSDTEYARRQAHYDAEASENPLSRSENQAAINQYDRSAQKQIETARNVATITGATPEYGLAVQQAAANGRADLMSNIAANASTRADRMRERSEQSRQAQYATEQARRNERNTTYANLATNAANAFGSIVDSYQTQKATEEPAPFRTKEVQIEHGAQVNADARKAMTGVGASLVRPANDMVGDVNNLNTAIHAKLAEAQMQDPQSFAHGQRVGTIPKYEELKIKIGG